MRLLSLFSGIGSFEKALSNLEVPYELVAYCEIDKYASKAYSLIHNVPESMNLGDITKVDTSELGVVDMVTYGFPCQDISNAGKQKGFVDENLELTRSGLFFEALRIIEETKPKFAICENVKALTGKKFKDEFETVLQCLNDSGYNNYWKVLNAKDYGIPQNRERVFIISIRKDIDQGYEFPQGFPLALRLKDVLEDEVDEKYYLSEKAVNGMIAHKRTGEALKGEKEVITGLISKQAAQFEKETDIACTLLARDYKGFGNQAMNCVIEREAEIMQVAQMYPNSGNPQAGRVYDADGISPAMDTCQGGNRMPKITEPM